jgi:hypothetical protein
MTVTMVIIGYLLIGAILGWMNHKMFDEVIFNTKFEVPFNVRGIYIVGCVIVIVVLSPIIAILDLVMKLKPKK